MLHAAARQSKRQTIRGRSRNAWPLVSTNEHRSHPAYFFRGQQCEARFFIEVARDGLRYHSDRVGPPLLALCSSCCSCPGVNVTSIPHSVRPSRRGQWFPGDASSHEVAQLFAASRCADHSGPHLTPHGHTSSPLTIEKPCHENTEA